MTVVGWRERHRDQHIGQPDPLCPLCPQPPVELESGRFEVSPGDAARLARLDAPEVQEALWWAREQCAYEAGRRRFVLRSVWDDRFDALGSIMLIAEPSTGKEGG